MRRILSTKEQRRRAARRARYEAKQRSEHARRLQRYKAGLPASSPVTKRKKKLQRVRIMPAPPVFSFIHSPEQLIDYFEDARSWLRNKFIVNFDLSGVSAVTPDGIALLVAKVSDKEFRSGMAIRGVSPQDPVAARLFDESRFYNHVKASRLVPRDNRNLLLHKTTLRKVEPGIARDAGILAVKHLYGDGRKIRSLYEVLIGCMANTNNHASAKKRKKYDWWLFVCNSPDEKRTVFTFLDLGVGIFRSIRLQGIWRAALESLGLNRNVDIVPKLFAGEVASRTGKPERGKGIPRIYERANDGTFSRFVMVSNDVYANLITGDRRTLSRPFQGTFFFFEITAR